MAMHVLKEGFRVSDDRPFRVPYGGERGGAPRARPPHAFPWLLGDRHVVNFSVEKVHACVLYHVVKDLLVMGESCVLESLLSEVAQR